MDRNDLCGDIEALVSTCDAPEANTKVDRTAPIERIAAVLDIPPNAFVQPDGSHGDEARVFAENAEVLKIFAAIVDPDARQRGLAYLRWISDQSKPQ